MFFIFFVQFIPEYFILLDNIINWIIFLISLMDCSLWVKKYNFAYRSCRQTIEFISSNSSLVDSLEISRYMITWPVSEDGFTSSIPIWMPVISFSTTVAFAKTSKKFWIQVVREDSLSCFCSYSPSVSSQPFTVEYDVTCGYFYICLLTGSGSSLLFFLY